MQRIDPRTRLISTQLNRYGAYWNVCSIACFQSWFKWVKLRRIGLRGMHWFRQKSIPWFLVWREGWTVRGRIRGIIPNVKRGLNAPKPNYLLFLSWVIVILNWWGGFYLQRRSIYMRGGLRGRVHVDFCWGSLDIDVFCCRGRAAYLYYAMFDICMRFLFWAASFRNSRDAMGR